MEFYCNPLDLAYRYQDVRAEGTPRTVHREGADPSIVRYRGRYYLFASMSGGFWHSADLVHWDFRPTRKIPAFDYAPDVREVDGALIVSASRAEQNCPFFRSVDPLSDDFVEVSPGTFPFWDPNVFQDEDGRTYLYWGCSSRTPLMGIELDRSSLEPVGGAVELISGDPVNRGWERIGEDNCGVRQGPDAQALTELFGDAPFIEGPWMTKHGHTYYLQYAAPAAECNTYADGCYEGTGPLGPFVYSAHSPFSVKPGGFITGAGHGSTFQDAHGNWWHTATMRISVNHGFERRIGLFPAGFDEYGALFCNQNFGDYPTVVPDRRFDPWTEAFAGWMLLSYQKDVTASSTESGHPPALAVDEDVRDWWVASRTAPGEWLSVDLGNAQTVHAIQVNLADEQTARHAPAIDDGEVVVGTYRGIDRAGSPTELLIEISEDGRRWITVSDSRGSQADTPHGFFVLDGPQMARHVRVTAGRLPYDAPFAVSGLRVFGTSRQTPPSPVAATAHRQDECAAALAWTLPEDADGVNIRYGLSPDKLYRSWLTYGRSDLEIRSLNAGHAYWFRLDVFNAGGITEGPLIKVDADSAAATVDHRAATS